MSNLNNIVILGAGAIGSVLGISLSKNSKNKVILIARNKRFNYFKKSGIFLKNPLEVKTERIHLKEKIDFELKDTLLILSIKAIDLKQSLEEIKKYIVPTTTIFTIQNGYGIKNLIYEILKEENIPIDNIFRSVTGIAATVLDDGQINYYGGKVILSQKFLNCGYKNIFDKSFFKVEYAKNIKFELWKKLIINSIINPLSLIFNSKNSIIAKDEFNNLKVPLLKEGILVAKSEDINIDISIDEFNKFIDTENISSMLQDYRKKNETEIDFINGALIKIAEKKSISVPINRYVYNLVKQFETLNLG